MRSSRIAVLFLAVVCLAGCGKAGEVADATVQGRVTLDGQPLPSGLIQFKPSSSAGGSIASIEIKDGTYRGKAFSGQMRVVLTSMKVVGKRRLYDDQDGSPEGEVTRQILPERYNKATELIADIKPEANEFNFDLTSE
jgi:hypothetical protein